MATHSRRSTDDAPGPAGPGPSSARALLTMLARPRARHSATEDPAPTARIPLGGVHTGAAPAPAVRPVLEPSAPDGVPPHPAAVDPERTALDAAALAADTGPRHDWDDDEPDEPAGLLPAGELPDDDARATALGGTTDDVPLTALPDAPGAVVTGAPLVDNPTGAPRAKSGRAGRDMVAAVGVGVGLGAVAVASLLLYRPAFVLVIAVAVMVSVVELTRALRAGHHLAPLAPLLLGSLVMVVLAWERGPTGLTVGFLLTVFAVLLYRLGEGPVGYLRDASAGVLVALYVPLLAGFAVLLTKPDDGAVRAIAFIATVVASDVGGFAAGVMFGKHPMARSVSPKKSWEGMAGSITACVVAGALLVGLALGGPWWGGALFGVAIAVSATLGDLGESLIKRDLAIKDMGTLLPGHGGLMDRMDSLLPSAAVAYLLLSVIVPG